MQISVCEPEQTLRRKTKTAFKFCLEESIRNKNIDLEQKLRFPLGVIAVWEYALKSNLPRTALWDLSSLKCPQVIEAVKFASYYYKRGVFCFPEENSYDRPTKTTQHFDVSFEKTLPLSHLELTDSFYIIDAKVYRLYPILQKLSSEYLLFEVSENLKNLQGLSIILERFYMTNKAKKIVVIGGGILIDLCTFAVHLLGLEIIVYPSTLLAMVDVAISGKTGINFMPYGKNMLGSFFFPTRVHIYPNFLKTLSIREFYSGAAECFKHILLLDNEDLLEELAQITSNNKIEDMYSMLPLLIKVKSDIIQKDPYEHNIRKTLNLGHTLAHALEALSQSRALSPSLIISHGEAVMLGLVFAILLSRELKCISESKCNRLIHALKKSRCILSLRKIDQYLQINMKDLKSWQLLIPYLKQDKKQISSENKSFLLWVILKESTNCNKIKMQCEITSVSYPVLEKCWKRLVITLGG